MCAEAGSELIPPCSRKATQHSRVGVPAKREREEVGNSDLRTYRAYVVGPAEAAFAAPEVHVRRRSIGGRSREEVKRGELHACREGEGKRNRGH